MVSTNNAHPYKQKSEFIMAEVATAFFKVEDMVFLLGVTRIDLISKSFFHFFALGSFLELDVFRTRHRSMTQEQWDEEDELFLWLKHNKASLNSTKLKSIIRRHIPPAVRARLWQEVSGGTRFMSRVPNLYHDTCEKLFGKGKFILRSNT